MVEPKLTNQVKDILKNPLKGQIKLLLQGNRDPNKKYKNKQLPLLIRVEAVQFKYKRKLPQWNLHRKMI